MPSTAHADSRDEDDDNDDDGSLLFRGAMAFLLGNVFSPRVRGVSSVRVASVGVKVGSVPISSGGGGEAEVGEKDPAEEKTPEFGQKKKVQTSHLFSLSASTKSDRR